MAPSDMEQLAKQQEEINQAVVADNVRLCQRVTVLEKQAEAFWTFVEIVILGATLYLAWPYLEIAFKKYGDRIPGVSHDT